MTKSSKSKVASTAQVAAAFGFLAKAAAEEFVRDDSPDGAHHSIRAAVMIEVDGAAPVYRDYVGTTDTGHASVRASSVGAKPGEVLAYVASKLNATARAALYRELAEVYAANDGKLPVTAEAVEEADEALSRLRQRCEQAVRGTFRVNYNRVESEAAEAAEPVAKPVAVKPAAKPASKPAAKPIKKGKGK